MLYNQLLRFRNILGFNSQNAPQQFSLHESMISSLLGFASLPLESYFISNYSVVKDLSSRSFDLNPRSKAPRLNLVWNHHV